jgi:hypothetical protein
MTLIHALELYNKANGTTLRECDLDSEVDMAAVRAIQEYCEYVNNLCTISAYEDFAGAISLVIWQAKQNERMKQDAIKNLEKIESLTDSLKFR